MNIFEFRDELISNYLKFSRSFAKFAASDIRTKVEEEIDKKRRYTPDPLLQINPNYEPANLVEAYCKPEARGDIPEPLHAACARIFRFGSSPMRLYSHQIQAIDLAQKGRSYVVTTGTGSGKSMTFFIPIFDRILKEKEKDPRARTRAIILYPMNALANSQQEEIGKFLKNDPDCGITVRRYTGQESRIEREEIQANPPDILLTNYMMLELMLMRPFDRPLIANCRNLEFLVLDELHTYRGRQGSDVAMLVRKLRTQLQAEHLQCIGTSATMSSVGSRQEQNRVVANFASRIFGTEIGADCVIGERLESVTDSLYSFKDHPEALKKALQNAADGVLLFRNYEEFRENALAVWLESKLSISDTRTRAKPLPVADVVRMLSEETGLSTETAANGLKTFLSQFGRNETIKTPSGKRPFAFKLHQFVSGPGKVYVTLEPEGKRIVTLDGQAYVTEKHLPLFEAHFCLDCGQEYLPVWINETKGEILGVSPRSIDEQGSSGRENYGYICPVRQGQTFTGEADSLPEDWHDPKRPDRIKSSRKKDVPVLLRLSPEGRCTNDGTEFWLLRGKFKLCVNCLRVYTGKGRDKNRLIGLSGEGRSSATSMLTLQMLRQLYRQDDASVREGEDNRKLLGFSDNRQDTALQSGHFNDFIERLLLRGALVAVLRSGAKEGRSFHIDALVNGICSIFRFDDPDNLEARHELLLPSVQLTVRTWNLSQEALHFSIGYRLLKDLRDLGFYTNPSLEKLGLQEVDYERLKEICGDEKLFAPSVLLGGLPPEDRYVIARTVLDEMRRRQCILAREFDPSYQEQMLNDEHRLLNDRWSPKEVMGDDARLTGNPAVVLSPVQGVTRKDIKPIVFSERSAIITALIRLPIWSFLEGKIPGFVPNDRHMMHQMILTEIMGILVKGGQLRKTTNKYGSFYQIEREALLWTFPKEEKAASSNDYYRWLYLSVADLIEADNRAIFSFESREHTAQVSATEREDFEMRFRATAEDKKAWAEKHPNVPFQRLPVLYCSPTMELGIDIAALNYVYMRNIPPTAANYVQRAGRAGRSGQQALSLSYCTSQSPHDQWFFSHPEEMVQGVVKEPTLDLTNESLVKSHLHSVWLATVNPGLPNTASEVLELTKPEENYPIKDEFRVKMQDESLLADAIRRGKEVIKQIFSDVKNESWYSDSYVERVMREAYGEFDRAFDRWRDLYTSTISQLEMAHRILMTPGLSKLKEEWRTAKQRHNDAVNQKALLDSGRLSDTSQSNDFYTYRYLASQGFLPGYNFPEMPLMAWVPAGKNSGEDEQDELISRSRFLGLTEFGPRNLIYHRGRIYRIERLKIRVGERGATGDALLPTRHAWVCPECGFAHLDDGTSIYNQCENCGEPLTAENSLEGLYQVSMVETREVERITVQDENRRTWGFDTRTLYRFGDKQKKLAEISFGGRKLADLTYVPSAQVWRVNLGWKARVNQQTKGFLINPITGYWLNAGPDADELPESTEDKENRKVHLQTIVPYVSDTRNILLLSPNWEDLGLEDSERNRMMATLEAALQRSIERTYQIESSEISVEPLPSADDRRLLLIYEQGEGGTGVLRHLCETPEAIGTVAKNALSLMHYDLKGHDISSMSVEDLEDCDTKKECLCGCYECLLNYYNQPDHALINRRDPHVLRYLLALAQSAMQLGGSGQGQAPMPELKKPEALSPLEQFEHWAARNGWKIPDAVPKVFKSLKLSFPAAYSKERCCLSFEHPTEETLETMDEIGWSLTDLSDPKQWAEQMAAFPELKKES